MGTARFIDGCSAARSRTLGGVGAALWIFRTLDAAAGLVARHRVDLAPISNSFASRSRLEGQLGRADREMRRVGGVASAHGTVRRRPAQVRQCCRTTRESESSWQSQRRWVALLIAVVATQGLGAKELLAEGRWPRAVILSSTLGRQTASAFDDCRWRSCPFRL